MRYVIDGYNLLRFIQKNSDYSSFTDIQMCRIISVYLGITKQTGVVVFDGVGPPDKTALMELDCLEIAFSGQNREADDIIEDIIGRYSAPKMLIVVSDDRRIIAQAKKRKSNPSNCIDFWVRLDKAISKSKKGSSEPTEKRTGISDLETQLWMDEFGL